MVLNPGISFILMTVLTLTTGTAFIMWLGEQITDRGIGNGMSLLIFTGIVAGLPRGVVDLVQKVQTNQWGSFTIVAMLLLVAGMAAVVAFIVFVERSERRIPIQSARRIVGRRMMGGQSSHLPLKVNSGGVMPVIFAGSILSAPMLLSQTELVQNSRFLQPIFDALTPGYPWYEAAVHPGHHLLRLLLHLHRDEAGRHCRQLPQVGIVHPRNPSRQAHLGLHQRHSHPHHAGWRHLSDYHFAGAHLPDLGHSLRQDVAYRHGSSRACRTWITHGLGVNFYFGGTSLLIVVGVAMDTVNQIESQLIMRHYDGFSPRSGRIRGRKTW